MRIFSTKRIRAERNLRRIKRRLDKNPENLKCFFYPSEQKSCYYHIVPKSEGLIWIDMEDNLLPIGQTAHNILKNQSNSEIKALPRFNQYIERMEQLNKQYYQRYLMELLK